MKVVVFVLSLLAVSSWANAYTFDSEVSPQIQQQMLQDLQFINGIQGSDATPLHQEIFGRVDGASYTQFFSSRVNTIGMALCSAEQSAMACVSPFSHNKMFLTKNFVDIDHPQIARMMVVFHEARHTEIENGSWVHATCPIPFLTPWVPGLGNLLKNFTRKQVLSIWTQKPLSGKAACDKTVYGSYGSSSIMLKNISKFCTNCNGKVKLDAGLYADDQVDRIIDTAAHDKIIEDFK